ncbi:MAG: class D beta-lactamase [Colwellia sp.]|nr:class D beta-lactamase [Colwellia sp.]
MKKITSIICILLLSSLTTITHASSELCVEDNKDCTFVLLSNKVNKKVSQTASEEQTGQSSITEESETLMMVNKARATQQYSPFSTFKVPNSLIGLDTQIIKSTKQSLTFDKEKYPVQKWWPPVWKLPDYDLSSAFKFSMVAIYRQLATDIGQQKMQSYLTNFTYGNQNISSGLDSFWLDGSMKISALEQVKFLQQMNTGMLAVKLQSIEALKEIMLVESTTEYKLYAKTGAGRANGEDKTDKSMLGWYIGFVENADGVHYFAFNFTRDSYTKMKALRVSIARNHLKQAGIIK